MAEELPQRDKVARLRARRNLGARQADEVGQQMARLDGAGVVDALGGGEPAELGEVAAVGVDAVAGQPALDLDVIEEQIDRRIE